MHMTVGLAQSVNGDATVNKAPEHKEPAAKQKYVHIMRIGW
jgi:hypothetical protein